MTRVRIPVTALVSTLLVACAGEPPTSPGLPAADVVPTPRVFVLNTQLRGIINPDIEPSTATGHIQLKLRENEDGSFGVEWQGRIFNRGGERFFRATVGMAGGEVDPILTLFRLGGDGIACDVIDLDAQGEEDVASLPADIALALILNPEIYEARIESLERPDGAIVGFFGILDPDILVGFNPQPDPPQGRVVRCAA